MARQIFVNLPIRNMERSKAYFQTFTKKPIADATRTTSPL